MSESGIMSMQASLADEGQPMSGPAQVSPWMQKQHHLSKGLACAPPLSSTTLLAACHPAPQALRLLLLHGSQRPSRSAKQQMAKCLKQMQSLLMLCVCSFSVHSFTAVSSPQCTAAPSAICLTGSCATPVARRVNSMAYMFACAVEQSSCSRHAAQAVPVRACAGQ